ncbi:MAG: hypothetical protein LBL66_02340 [Clostridiales bacterium]|jgi:hypothetical protein|nr:hypothetical protein [Clostridiales bacterium]
MFVFIRRAKVEGQAIVRRWGTGCCVILWGCAAVFLGVTAVGLVFAPDAVALAGTCIVGGTVAVGFTGCAVWWSVYMARTPSVLARVSGGTLYLCPDKKTSFAVDPAKTFKVSHQNHYRISMRRKFKMCSYGELYVTADSNGVICLRWAKDVAAARRTLENFILSNRR